MAIPDNTRRLVQQRLRQRAQKRWPQLDDVTVRYRGSFAYIDAITSDGETLPLCRLRYLGSTTRWGFAFYLASKDGYENSGLPTGSFTGAPRRSPRLLLRPLPQRPHRLGLTKPPRTYDKH